MEVTEEEKRVWRKIIDTFELKENEWIQSLYQENQRCPPHV
jgi:hypothetical protein